ncbi:amidohydrolase family protein [Streptomyces pseudovenezuelae]|uniref:Amidohydrolase 3 domain-containing protein n=1 Tax=Streptomyces pseudovenezuelae TaxID=67350 RepID=A0ABT6LPH3_9ACTN|nr:hypothetical protein [Streptomyces pseudovenezuelae]
MRDTGLLVAAGTDATRVSSYNPWLSLSWLVTGRTIGDTLLYPATNRVDRVTALEMYTTAGAALTGESELKGTITEGKYGDLAVLSADYFSVPDEDIDRIESLVTVAGGKVVHAAGDYENIAAPPSRRSAPPGARSPASGASRPRREQARPAPSPRRPPTPRNSARGATGAGTSTAYRGSSAGRSIRWTVASEARA